MLKKFKSEFKKLHVPKKKDLLKDTAVVLIVSIILSCYFGGIDYLASQFVSLFF